MGHDAALPGIIDQHVEPAAHSRNQTGALCVIDQIGLHKAPAQLIGQRPASSDRVACVNHDFKPIGRQTPGDRRTDPAGRARNERDRPVRGQAA